MTTKTLLAVPQKVVWMLFHHLPEHPYPSGHPSALRRAPRDVRG